MEVKYKKIFQRLVYYALPIGLLIFFFMFRKDVVFFFGLGNYAIYLLGAILFIKPLAVIFEVKFFWQIVSYRRELGILDFWLFFSHAAGMSYLYGFSDPTMWGKLPSFVYWGVAAGIGMFVVAGTSNDYAVKLLKRNWKRVQSLTYLVFLFALLHAGVRKDQLFLYLSIFFVFAVLKIIEFRKVRKILRGNFFIQSRSDK